MADESDRQPSLVVGSQKRSQSYPEPLVFEPKGDHKVSFVILHGRGSNAQQFGPALLETKLPNGHTFKDEFPDARFIFPTASFRRSTVLKRIPITQWFNNFSLENPSIKQDLQIDGLRETSQFIHGLLQREIEVVGAKNVFLGGLSQGCAAMLISLILWKGPVLGGAFGMSGWLPMKNILVDNIGSVEPLNEDDVIFETDDEINSEDERSALQPLFNELGVEFVESKSFFETPIFLGHGCEDEKVSVCLGREAADSLTKLGCIIRWREYQDLGHWYHGPELAEIQDWVRQTNKG